jgi:hypothetical protein
MEEEHESVVTFGSEQLGMEVEEEQAAPIFPPVTPAEVQVRASNFPRLIQGKSTFSSENSQTPDESPEATLDGNLPTRCGAPKTPNSIQHSHKFS